MADLSSNFQPAPLTAPRQLKATKFIFDNAQMDTGEAVVLNRKFKKQQPAS